MQTLTKKYCFFFIKFQSINYKVNSHELDSHPPYSTKLCKHILFYFLFQGNKTYIYSKDVKLRQLFNLTKICIESNETECTSVNNK